MFTNDQLDLIQSLTKVDRKTINTRLLKIMEELGECSQAFISYEAVSGCTYKGCTQMNVLEEALDTFLCVLSLVYQIADEYNIDQDKVQKLINKKLVKWENKVTTPHIQNDDCM